LLRHFPAAASAFSRMPGCSEIAHRAAKLLNTQQLVERLHLQAAPHLFPFLE
jgi:hypothetical protein